MDKNKREVFNTWKSAIKKDLKILIQKSGFDLDTVQEQLQTFIKKADRLILGNDIEEVVKKLKNEHAKLLKIIDQSVKEEVKKANKILLEKKEKLKEIQKKFEKDFSISIKRKPQKKSRKKTSKKKTARKQTTRKSKKAVS